MTTTKPTDTPSASGADGVATAAPAKGRKGAVTALGFSQAVDNSEGGLVNSFFPLIRNAFGLDRFGRKRVLFVVTGVWGLFTVAAGFAPNYPALLALYIISVIGTVASEPIINGLLPDLFSKPERGKAYGTVRSIGAGLGIVIGPAIGQFGNNPEGWRWAMWTMGGISVLSGILILFLVPNPQQRTVSVTEDPEAGVFKVSDAIKLIKIPTIAMLALMLPLVTSLILLAFYATFVVDARGFTVTEGTYAMAVFSIGAMISAFVGGLLGDLFTRWFGARGRVLLMQIYLVTFASVVFLATQVDFGSKPAQYAMTFLMGLVFSIGFSGCVLPMVSTVVPRQLSATAFALLFSLIQGALTAVLSLVMGQLSDLFGLSRTFLYIVVLPYLANAFFWFVFYRTYPRDAARQEQLTLQVDHGS